MGSAAKPKMWTWQELPEFLEKFGQFLTLNGFADAIDVRQTTVRNYVVKPPASPDEDVVARIEAGMQRFTLCGDCGMVLLDRKPYTTAKQARARTRKTT
jgi:hypothetical protein